MKQILYAAYGSNLLKKRFMVYINGGEYRDKVYDGCRNKTKPEEFGWMYVPHRLYFAKKSSLWGNGGIAFLNCKKETDSKYCAIVRLWKILEEQFEDIHKQEGKNLYNTILFLGEKDGLEIKTITGCWMDELNVSSLDYLKIIKDGLKETTELDEKKIESYLNKFIPEKNFGSHS